MKKAIVAVCITLLTTGVMAQVKCVPDGRGGMCCWDVRVEGPFRPIGC